MMNTMGSRWRLAALAAASLLCAGFSGCVLPIPYDAHLSPDLSGVVVRNGKPLEGARVRLQPSGRPELSTVTDASGRFFFEAVTEHRYLKPVYGDYYWQYRVQIDVDQITYLGLIGGAAGVASEPLAPRTLTCDLSHMLPGQRYPNYNTWAPDTYCSVQSK